MEEAEITASFDGRPTAVLIFRGFAALNSDHALVIAYRFGYKLQEAESSSRGVYRMVFQRDDSPDVRRRVAQAYAHPPALQGRSPTPVHAGGEWVSVGEAVRARRNLVVSRDISYVGLIVLPGSAALGLLVAAVRQLGNDGGAAFTLFYLTGICIAGAVLLPMLAKRMHRRDLDLVERFQRQEALATGVAPPSPPPPAGPFRFGEGPSGPGRAGGKS